MLKNIRFRRVPGVLKNIRFDRINVKSVKKASFYFVPLFLLIAALILFRILFHATVAALAVSFFFAAAIAGWFAFFMVCRRIDKIFDICRDFAAREISGRIPLPDKLAVIQKAAAGLSSTQTLTEMKNHTQSVARSAEAVFMDISNINSKLRKINKNVSNISEDTQSINSSIDAITNEFRTITDVSQTTALEVWEISGIVNDIRNTIDHSQQIAMDAKDAIHKTEEITASTIETSKKLGGAAEEIGKINGTVKRITYETHILSINAAVEAARAGQFGLGFSVVAREIKSLAENTNSSAKMIESIIGKIQSMVVETIRAISDVGVNVQYGSQKIEDVYQELRQILENISTIDIRIGTVSTKMQEQSDTFVKISSTLDTINDSNSQITHSIQSVLENIEKQSKATKKLNDTSLALNESSEELHKMVAAILDDSACEISGAP